MKTTIHRIFRLLLFPLCMAGASALNAAPISAQDTSAVRQEIQEKPVKFSFYGFVRNDFTWDSRQNMAVVGELFHFVPLDRNLNSRGEDLNAIPNSRLLAVVTRLGLDLDVRQFGRTKIDAKVEADFCGTSSTYFLVMLRHAYIRLRWSRHSLLAGQSWHPMSADMQPLVLSLNTGAPFNPFSRTPQVRYDVALHPTLSLSAAAMYQMQYTSPGPDGLSPYYQINGGLPELYLGLDFAAHGFRAGLSGEYMMLRPRTTGYPLSEYFTEPLPEERVRVSDRVHSFSATAYFGYTYKSFNLKAKTIYGQNLSHLLMLSGYGVTARHTDGSRSYSPLTSSVSWINATYGQRFMAGLFAGYMKNLGSSRPFVSDDMIYVRGYRNIDQIVRVAPSFSYNIKGFSVGVEYEMTGAFYGDRTDDHGRVYDTRFVPNHRVYVVVSYTFSTK